MKSILLAAAFAVASTAASAATFVFPGPASNTDSSYSATVDGIDLTVTALSGVDTMTGTGGTAADIRFGNSGFGVEGGNGGRGIGFGEALVLNFSPNPVTLVQTILFERGDIDETFTIFADGIEVLTGSINFDPNEPTEFDTSSITSPFSTLAIVGTTAAGTSATGFRVERIEVSSVPLPAGGLLLLSGFGVLALRRKFAA